MVAPNDIFLILFLAFLEGILSIDNALVLALLAKPLPKEQQRKALTYGLAGAVFFRLIALFVFTNLMRLTWIKFAGGGYLVYIAVKHFLKPDKTGIPAGSRTTFWKVVLVIELTDIAFAVDSILAAVALTPKFWVIFAGGFLGVVMMRFAAVMMIALIKRLPSLETTAYLLVFTIGLKVILEATRHPALDFHSSSAPAFWVFWGIMSLFIGYGLIPRKR